MSRGKGGTSALERRTGLTRRTPLNAKSSLRRARPLEKRGPISPATRQQREVVKDRACIVCGAHPCDPAHLIDRSLVSVEAGDDPRAVVPLCRLCHRDYDDGELDLTPYLEPHWRSSVAWAVEVIGLFRALRRISKRHWMIVPSEEIA